MNKKNLFFGLAVLLWANQVSAGWHNGISSSANDARILVVSNKKALKEQFFLQEVLNDYGVGFAYQQTVIGMRASGSWDTSWKDFIDKIALPYITERQKNEHTLAHDANKWTGQQLIYAYNLFRVYAHAQGVSEEEKSAVIKMANILKKIYIDRELKGCWITVK